MLVAYLSSLIQILTAPVEDQEVPSSTPGVYNSADDTVSQIYPDTDSLLEIAQRVHAARTNVTEEAENMLGDADKVWAYRK